MVFPVIEASPSSVPVLPISPSTTQPEPEHGSFLTRYLRKFKGDATKRPPARSRTVARDAAISGLTAFICIFCIAEIHSQGLILTRQDLYLLIPPFGATAVLVFAMPAAPVAQVRRGGVVCIYLTRVTQSNSRHTLSSARSSLPLLASLSEP